jgi:hypothetical protein
MCVLIQDYQETDDEEIFSHNGAKAQKKSSEKRGSALRLCASLFPAMCYFGESWLKKNLKNYNV